MIRNYLLITFRGLMKNKLFIAINVFGMAIAIACCIVSYLAFEYDARFDKVHVQGDAIYRVGAVRAFEHNRTRFGYAALPLGEIVDKTFTDVSRSSRYLDRWSNFRRNDDLFPIEVSYVDPEFFQMFSFDFITGGHGQIKDRAAIFVSEALAVRLFGSPQEAYGRSITQVYDETLKEVRIAGVFRDQPANSSFHKMAGCAYMHFENIREGDAQFRDDDWTRECSLFVRIDDAGRVPAVQKQLQAFIANNNRAREDFQVEAFTLDGFPTMAHRDRDEHVQAKTWEAPPLSAIFGSMIMSLLILLIACFNLTNTSIALSARRLNEIGIRKVMGSMRSQLVLQFIGETTCICFLALIVALGFSDLLVEGWNLITGNNIHLEQHDIFSWRLAAALVGILLFAGLAAGSYPAFYISKFEPVSILKGKLKFGGTNYFTRTLLGLQFAISLMAVVSAIGFFQNARFQRQHDLGFDVRGSVMAWVNNRGEFDTYRNALQNNPHIRAMAGAKTGIFSDRAHDAVKHGSKQIAVDIIGVGDNYLATVGLSLVEGRDFIKDSETDRREAAIITQNMATLFGWGKPLGKEIIWKDSVRLFVVGVVKDVYTHGLWRELEPMMITYVAPDDYRQIVVNTDASTLAAVDEDMKAAWAAVFPNRLYNGRTMDAGLQSVDRLNTSLVYSYVFLGLVSVLLSATGLFALVSLNIVNRLKEIGVRKILGASVYGITRVINLEFVVIFVVGAAVGSWAGFSWTTVLMSSIWKYYQGVNTVTFAVAISTLFIILFLTIASKVYSVVTMNLVKTLRDQ